jgi:hypothetical protein
VLNAKIRDRVSDVRRHLVALRAAMAEFGEDFDLADFAAAHSSEDPVRLNQAKAVERGVDQLYNYATATAEQVHEAARIIADEFVPFYEAYRGWIGRGFADAPPRR